MERTGIYTELEVRNELLQLQGPVPSFTLAEVPWELQVMVDYCTTLLLQWK